VSGGVESADSEECTDDSNEEEFDCGESAESLITARNLPKMAMSSLKVMYLLGVTSLLMVVKLLRVTKNLLAEYVLLLDES